MCYILKNGGSVMELAIILYVMGIIMFTSSGTRRYLSDMEYNRTGRRDTNYNSAIRAVISIICFILGTYIMMNL